MSLIKELRRIMDLTAPEDEAIKKLGGTHMFVNGELRQIEKFLFVDDCVVVFNQTTDNFENIHIKTLEVWLPEAGVYAHPDGYYVIITKIPKRQWLKSYHSSFYRLDYIGDIKNKSNILSGIAGQKKVNIFVSSTRLIYYWKTLIGYIKDSTTIVCTNQAFSREIIDWDRDGTN